MRNGSSLPLALLATLFPALPAAAAGLLLQAEGKALSGDCAGGPAHLEGNHNTVTLTGICPTLLVQGIGNTVRLTVAPGGSIRVEGSGNRIAYAAVPPGPAIDLLGPDNAATPAEPQPAPSLTPAPAPAGPLRLGGADQFRLADCHDGEAIITGLRSAYVLTGSCRAVTVQGDLLTVQAELRPGARVVVAGRGDILTYTTPGRPPASMVSGPGSRVQRALPPE